MIDCPTDFNGMSISLKLVIPRDQRFAHIVGYFKPNPVFTYVLDI